MQGVGSNFSPIDFFVGSTSAGVQLISRALSPSGNYSKVNRLLIGLMGLGYLCTGAVAAAMAFPASSPADCEDGDLWNGYCYPYKDFPHGHYDAADGSIEFDHGLSILNEEKRRCMFFDKMGGGICSRGTHKLYTNGEEDKIVTCSPYGIRESNPIRTH